MIDIECIIKGKTYILNKIPTDSKTRPIQLPVIREKDYNIMSEQDKLNFKPVKDGVLIKLVEKKNTTKDGMIYLPTEVRELPIATVLKTGSTVTIVKEGDKVLLSTGEFELLKSLGENIAMTKEKFIIGIYDEE